MTTNTYFIDRQSDDYASALRKNAYNQQLAVGSVSPSPVPSLQQLNVSLSPSNHVNYIGTTGDHLLETHSVCALSFYVTLIFSSLFSLSLTLLLLLCSIRYLLKLTIC